jgi:hypothetical protein
MKNTNILLETGNPNATAYQGFVFIEAVISEYEHKTIARFSYGESQYVRDADDVVHKSTIRTVVPDVVFVAVIPSQLGLYLQSNYGNFATLLGVILDVYKELVDVSIQSDRIVNPTEEIKVIGWSPIDREYARV